MDKETKQEFNKLAFAIKKGFDGVDEQFRKVDERFKKVDERFEKMERNFDEKLENKIGVLKTELKDYIDRKTGELKGDIIAVIKGDRERDRAFKEKVLDVFRRKHMVSTPEADLMAELIR